LTPYFLIAFFSGFLLFFSDVFQRSRLAVTGRDFPGDKSFSNLNSIGFLKVGVVFVLACFVGLRASSVGTDTRNYERIFDALQLGIPATEAIQSSPQEPGFAFLMLTVKQLGGDFTSFLIVTSAITVFAIFFGLARVSKNFTLAVLLYILLSPYLEQFNGTRQALAVSLIFLASTFLDRNKQGFATYVGLSILAASFHTSALVAAALIVMFRKWNVTFTKLTWAIILSSATAATIWALPWVGSFASVLNTRYAGYIDGGREAGLGFVLIIAARVVLMLFALHLKPGENDMKYASLAVWGIIWMVLGINSVVISRFSSIFEIFLIVLVPNVMKDRKSSILANFTLLVGSFAYFASHLLYYGDLIPYILESSGTN
jgi:hypothetical protein